MKEALSAQTTQEDAPGSWRNVLSLSKDILPWIMLVANVIYGFAVKQSTSDRTQQQTQEDHIAIQDMRTQLADVGKQEAVLAAKVDMLISGTFKEHRDAQ